MGTGKENVTPPPPPTHPKMYIFVVVIVVYGFRPAKRATLLLLSLCRLSNFARALESDTSGSLSNRLC